MNPFLRFWNWWLRINAQYDEHAAKVRHDITDCPMEKQRQLLLAQSSRNFMNSL